MRLSKLYCDQPSLFHAIVFSPKLNIILAEIRLPENRNKDTHNLGKSTLGRLLDFCFLSTRNAGHFLIKHIDIFRKFSFLLEIELPDGSFVTIRRSVNNASKVSFKKHTQKHQDFSKLPENEWDHYEIPFKRSRVLLDGFLDWSGLNEWPYRKGLGYHLRSQEDYRDVFQLKKYAGPHGDWKPFLAYLLGFDSDLIKSHYDIEATCERLQAEQETLAKEFGGDSNDVSKIEGLLLLKKEEETKKSEFLSSFNFHSVDIEKTKCLVEKIDIDIANLNAERYGLQSSLKRIQRSLEDDGIIFEPDKAQEIFKQAGIFFEGQLKKDFDQLIKFNNEITEERRKYLFEESQEIREKLNVIDQISRKLQSDRAETLNILGKTDSFEKYKKLTDEIISLRADLAWLRKQREQIARIEELRNEIREQKNALQKSQEAIEGDITEKSRSDRESKFSKIRLYFNEFVESVTDHKALIRVYSNSKGHLEFRAEFLDDTGKATSADLGHTYRKLLCMGFDYALMRTHLDVNFPRFAYHDGFLESLDDRKKENLLSEIRKYAELGIQSILTAIDSDLPARGNESSSVFGKEEIVLTLHDEDESGRLFKIKAW